MKTVAAFVLAFLSVACSAKEIHGEVFVPTKGAGVYRFGGVAVVVLPMPALHAIRTTAEAEVHSTKENRKNGYPTDDAIRYAAWVRAVENATALGGATTNSDGIYRIEANLAKPAFVFCAAKRQLPSGGTEYHLWAVPIGSSDVIDLNQNNALQ